MINGKLGAAILKSYVNTGRPQTIRVSGISMMPLIQNGDCAVVTAAEKLRRGDIIVFQFNGELLVHRVVRKRRNRIYAKGDNAYSREFIEPERIIGRVCAIAHPKGQRKEIRYTFTDRFIIAALSNAVGAYVQGGRSITSAKKTLRYKLLQAVLKSRQSCYNETP